MSGFSRTATTDAQGEFTVVDVPFSNYHLVVTAQGFQPGDQDVVVRSAVPVPVKISLKVGTQSTEVTVSGEGSYLINTAPVTQTNVDRGLFQKLPLESQSSSLSSLVTLATPGVAADSNGLFHGMGDHASNSFSIDGQPITDQQARFFQTSFLSTPFNQSK